MPDESVREFGAMTDDLNAMADWLLACGVDTVALESTGVYWIPVYEVLEQRGLKVWLVDARQMKYVPGRKSDVQDCQWLQKLMSLGCCARPGARALEVCVVRAVARQREVLLTEQASWVQRMQKALVQMNIQLTEVLSRCHGHDGPGDHPRHRGRRARPEGAGPHRHSRVKASEQDIAKALTGNWRDEHLFVLRQALAMYDDIARHLGECDAKLQGAAGRTRRRPRSIWARRRARAARRAQSSTFARCWPTGPASISRASTGWGDGGDEDPVGDRPRPEPLRQRQALLLVAGPVPGHEDQRRQGAVEQAPSARPTGCARR
jgi:transposase